MFSEAPFSFMPGCKVTFITFELFNFAMDLHMYSQIVFTGETFATYVANKRFFSRMFSHVNNELAFSQPTPVTIITLDRSHICMCYQMLGKHVSSYRNIVALVTFEQL